MTFEQLTLRLDEWRKQRNLADPKAQTMKVMEEVGELSAAINKQNREKLIDSIGDTLVTVILLAQMEGMDPTKCLESAWQVIADRKGKTVNGLFVKSEDLTNADL